LDRWPNNLQIDGHALERVEVLHGPERRRRWSAEEKARIVAESFEPDTVVSSVARRHGLHRNQLYAWRRELQDGEFRAAASGVTFAPIVLTDTSTPVASKDIEIALGGAVVRVGVGVDLGLLSDILRLLKPST
jgi:transposase